MGVDGDGDTSLIQAGVSSSYTNSGALIQPWTEVIVGSQNTLVDLPAATFTASAGDSITVTIAEGDPVTNSWTIAMTDHTTGQTYQTTVTYDGSGATAEWVIESPTDLTTGHIDNIAPFFNTIDFTQMSASQPATGLQYMSFAPGFVNGGALNSLLDSSGFAVGDQEQVPAPLAIGTDG